MRVLPVDFARPNRRPAIISALGIVAIVIACLSFFASAIGGLFALGFMIRTQTTAAISAVSVAAQARQQQQAAARQHDEVGIATGMNGLESAERTRIIAALSRVQSLSKDQKLQLERLLAKGGKTIFPQREKLANTQLIRQQVSDSGRMTELAGESSAYYIARTGKIEVHADRAMFFPNTPGDETIRVQKGFDPDEVVQTPAPTFAPPTFTPLPPYKVRGSASAITISEAIASGLLAIYLLVVGILVLRQHRHARGMQMIFAFIKLPLAIVCAAGWMMTVTDHVASTSPNSAQSFLPQTWLLILLMVGCAYPIALLITLFTSNVKKYYRGGEIE